MQGRRDLTPSDIKRILDNKHPIYMRDKEGGYRVKKLYSHLQVPSHVHGYSLAIEYMKKWFIEKFPKDYFNIVHINGKHVLDDWKYFNKANIVREPPMLAITPTVDFDYDRETLDLYLADREIYLKRSNYQKSFFKDYDRDLFIGMDMQGLRMNFNYKVRVRTRAQQLDLMKMMQLAFRIGATQQSYVSADFHIPKHIILDIAKKAGFDIDEEKGTVKDTLALLSYLNQHSELPIMFKMRSINQKPEFFLRMRDLCVHISCRDKLQVDDGERSGHLDTNFHIELQATLTIPVPMFYVYFSADELVGIVPATKEEGLGLYSFCEYEIPLTNERGWAQVALTSYLCDEGEQEIDLSPVFSGNTNLDIVMQHSLKNYLSPQGFIDVRAYRSTDTAINIRTKMDYVTKKLHILDPIRKENISLVIYGDMEYINNMIISIRNYHRQRIDLEKETIPGTNMTSGD